MRARFGISSRAGRGAGATPASEFVRMQISHGAWRSLVAHSAGGRAVAGSNPVAPIRELRADRDEVIRAAYKSRALLYGGPREVPATRWSPA